MKQSARRAAVAAVTMVSTIVAVGALAPPSTATPRLVVDDDGRQCGSEAYPTIAAALEDAGDGDRITVCPGVYVGSVEVEESVSIVGPVGAVASLDCLSPTPASLGDLDPTRFAVLQPADPSTDVAEPLVTLSADRAELAGLVLQGAVDTVPDVVDGFTLFTAAVAADGDHSGHRIHHNLIRLNTLGVEIGGDGRHASRVDHNCLRENQFGVANQAYRLDRGVVEANTSYRTARFAYEIGWGYAPTDEVTVRGNTSVEDGVQVYLENSSRARVVGNTVTRPGGQGVLLVGGNDDVQVVGNEITGSVTPGPGFQGIIVVAPQRAGQPPTAGLVVAGNRVRGFRTPTGTGNGIVIGTGSTTGARIVGNDVRDNQVAGLSIGAGSTDNLVVGNRLHDNTTVGLRVTGTGNRLVGNTVLGNGTDAEDLTDPDPADGVQLLNSWWGNRCETDRPPGAIC